MDILIIGNGFDLAHGLETRYKDFLDYCERLPSDDAIHKNLWLRYFLKLTRISPATRETWIDFETEIYNQISKFRNIAQEKYHKYCPDSENPDYQDNPNINAYFKEENINSFLPANALKTNKEKINFIYNQLRNFTKAFEKYLCETVNEKIDSLVTNPMYRLNLPVRSQNTPNELKVINFNYTNTCKKLYDWCANRNNKFKIELIHVHGRACSTSTDCDLVLGTKSFNKDDIN